MIYRCVKCGKTWGTVKGGDGAEYSGGLCSTCLRECLIPLYRKKQLREGNFDCFGKARSYCDQFQCLYRKNCLPEGFCSPETDVDQLRQTV